MKGIIIPAYDNMDRDEALRLSKQLSVSEVSSAIWGPKGHDVLDAEPPDTYRRFLQYGGLMVDWKIHDIPNTARNRVSGLWRKLNLREHEMESREIYITAHASGGVEMLKAAVEATKGTIIKILAITVLTSLRDGDCLDIYGEPPAEKVRKFVQDYILKSGVHGVVCSPLEIGIVSTMEGTQNLIKVVPATRLPGSQVGDQKRVRAPGEAIRDGATRLVCGREITEAKDPVESVRRILANIEKHKTIA